ncbi:MAG: hypothetical protein WBH31_08055 [Promethearchaeia archaeon]
MSDILKFEVKNGFASKLKIEFNEQVYIIETPYYRGAQIRIDTKALSEVIDILQKINDTIIEST